VRVILPVDYGAPGKRFPVLYLLHDAGGTYKIWTEKTDILKLARAFEAIIVMPDGGHGANAGWYTNWKDGSRQWETYHIDVMIRISSNTSTRSATAIAPSPAPRWAASAR